eukprot:7350112-Prymnesium_polylepis.1
MVEARVAARVEARVAARVEARVVAMAVAAEGVEMAETAQNSRRGGFERRSRRTLHRATSGSSRYHP